jgi:hypothetical protein
MDSDGAGAKRDGRGTELMTKWRAVAFSLTAILGPAMIQPEPAFAFACNVNAPPGGEVLLHKRPDARSKVIARLRLPAMVSDVAGVSWRGDWIYVRWSRRQTRQAEFSRGKRDGKGWVRIAETQGECED